MKIAILEFSNSHEECIYSFACLAQASGLEVVLVLSEKLSTQAKVFCPGFEVMSIPISQGRLSKIRNTRNLAKDLRKKRVSKIHFNTASGSQVRDFVLLAGKSFTYSGVLHDAEKLSKSFTQKLISRFVKRYFLLADYLKLHAKVPDGIQTEVIYPVYFPKTLSTYPSKLPGFRIVIPGQVEWARRDYEYLFEHFAGKELPQDLIFVLLGQYKHAHGNAEELERLLERTGLRNRVVLFDDFIQYEQYYQELASASILLPLIHPGKGNFEKYFQFQISGAWNLAAGLTIPLLMHRSFEEYSFFREIGLFYAREELSDRIWDLYHQRYRLEDARFRISACESLLFENQLKRFRHLLHLHSA